MKKCLIFLILFQLSQIALADFQNSLGVSSSQLNNLSSSQGKSIDDEYQKISFSHYFKSISFEDAPYAEADFFAKTNSLGATYSARKIELESFIQLKGNPVKLGVDVDSFSIFGKKFLSDKRTFFSAGYGEAEIERNGETQDYSVQVGKYINNHSATSITFNHNKDHNDLLANSVKLDYKSVISIAKLRYLTFRGAIQHIKPESRGSTNLFRLTTGYYPSKKLGTYLDWSKNNTTSQVNVRFTLGLSYFITSHFGIGAYLIDGTSTLDGRSTQDISGSFLSTTFRF